MNARNLCVFSSDGVFGRHTTPAGTLTSVYSFTCNGGPIYTVLQGQDANMYGVTPYEGGTERSLN